MTSPFCVKSNIIPKYSCTYHWLTDSTIIVTYFSLRDSVIDMTTSGSSRDILRSSTYQDTIHYLPFIILLTANMLHGFGMNPKYCTRKDARSPKNNFDASTVPHSALSTSLYMIISVFLFSLHTWQTDSIWDWYGEEPRPLLITAWQLYHHWLWFWGRHQGC